jgi:D-amino-acid dehydrogenase
MKLRLHALPDLLGWGLRFLHHSAPARHAAATEASFRLAIVSTELTRQLIQSQGLRCDASFGGTFKLFAGPRDLQGPHGIAQRLAGLGLRFDVLSAAQAVEREPALSAAASRVAAALHFPDDVAVDACALTKELARLATAAGAQVRISTAVRGIVVRQGAVAGVETDGAWIAARRVVVAGGCASRSLLRPLGLRLAVRPAKGYSLTFDVAHLASATPLPAMPVIDDAMHAAVTPLGRRLRAVGTAEFAGDDRSLDARRLDNLFALLQRLYPEIAARLDRSSGTPWAGLRPMSADGLPFIGPAGPPGLWLNTGHGHLGLTLALGSAGLLVDQLLDKAPAVPPEPFRAAR